MPTPGGGKPLRIFVKLEAAGAGTDFGKQLSSALNQQTNAIRSTVGTTLKLMQRETQQTVANIIKLITTMQAAGLGIGGALGGGGGGGGGGGKKGPTGLDSRLPGLLASLQQIRDQNRYGRSGRMVGSVEDYLSGDKGTKVRVRYDSQGRAVGATSTEDEAARARAAQQAQRDADRIAKAAELSARRQLKAEQDLLVGELAIARRRSDLQRQKMREDQQQYDQLERLAKKAGASEAISGRVQDALSQFGSSMRLTRERLGVNAQGQQYGQYTFERRAGLFSNARRGTVNSLTGAVSEEEIHGSSRLGQAWRNLVGDGNRLQQTLHLIGKAGEFMGKGLVIGLKAPFVLIDKLRYAAIGLSATFYSLARIGRGFEHILVDPVKQILNQTESSREFEAAIGGVAGGSGRARSINEAVRQNSIHSPLTIQEMRDIGRQFALIPTLAGGAASGTPGQVVGRFSDFSKLVTQLAIMDPEQGTQGALVALREGLAGEFRSLRQRLELQPESIASAYGTTTTQMSRDPQLFLKAVGSYANTYVGDQAIEKMGGLYTKRIEKLKDVIRTAAERIGDAGLFDSVNKMLKDAASSLFDWVNSPEFADQAKGLSANLATILKNVGLSAISFAQGLTGDKNAARGIGNLLNNFTSGMAKLSDSLPELARSLGSGLKNVGQYLQSAVDELKEANKSLTNPEAQKGIGDRIGEGVERGFIDRTAARTKWAIKYETPYGIAYQINKANIMGTGRWIEEGAASYNPFPRSLEVAPGAGLRIDALRDQINGVAPGSNRFTGGGKWWDARAILPLLGSHEDNTRVKINEWLQGFNQDADIYNPDTSSPMSRFLGIEAHSLSGLRGISEASPGGVSLAARLAAELKSKIGLLQYLGGTSAGGPGAAAAIRAVTQDIINKQADVVKTLPGEITSKARLSNMAFATSLSGVDPRVAGPILELIRSGGSPVSLEAGKQIGSLELPFNAAATTWRSGTYDQYRQFDTQTYEALAAAVESQGQMGWYSDRGLKQAQLGVALKAQQGAWDRRGFVMSNLGNMKDSERLLALGQSAADVEEANARVVQLKRSLDDLGQSFVKFGGDVRGAMENGFAKGIESMIKGTGTIKAVLAGLADDVISAFSRMAANNLMQGLFGDFLMPQANGTSGALGGFAKVGLGAAGSALGGAFGGLFSGWHAKGDVFHGPAIAGLGERGPEAIMPLTRTSSGQLGVVASGGMGSAGTNLIIVDSRAQAQQVAAASPHMINKIVELAERKVAHSIMNGNGPAGQAVKNRRTR